MCLSVPELVDGFHLQKVNLQCSAINYTAAGEKKRCVSVISTLRNLDTILICGRVNENTAAKSVTEKRCFLKGVFKKVFLKSKL